MHVYPVAGRFLFGVPHVEHDCEDPFCVESGAFSTEPPPEPADEPTEAPDEPGPFDLEE